MGAKLLAIGKITNFMETSVLTIRQANIFRAALKRGLEFLGFFDSKMALSIKGIF